MKRLESGDILKPSKIGMAFPAGILSMTVFALWFLLLMVPVIGLINKPDIVIRDLKNAPLELYLKIAGILIFIILLQITLRIIIKKKRILIDDSYVYVKNIFYSKEIEIINVKMLRKVSDRAALCTHIVLIYNNGSRAKISGWLMKWGEMDKLSDYIQSKNQ